MIWVLVPLDFDIQWFIFLYQLLWLVVFGVELLTGLFATKCVFGVAQDLIMKALVYREVVGLLLVEGLVFQIVQLRRFSLLLLILIF